jgi:hypothetical protein
MRSTAGGSSHNRIASKYPPDVLQRVLYFSRFARPNSLNFDQSIDVVPKIY